jgi:hypothetical protein
MKKFPLMSMGKLLKLLKLKLLKLGYNSFGSELLIYVLLTMKKNLDQILRSGFSIGVVNPPPGHPEISDTKD